MHRKLKSIEICGKTTIDKWLEISPSWTRSKVRLGSQAEVARPEWHDGFALNNGHRH
jgi:hypothetical protein